MKPPRKLHIKSYGCQMNVYDAQRMVDTLAGEGFVETVHADDADLVILNTCHIREKASEKVYSELGRLRAAKEDAARDGRVMKIAVAGCVAVDDKISISTVYRTVKLFEDAGIIERHDFREGRARYEQMRDSHHDHLINLRDGKVIEFTSEEIEKLQAEIARKLGYKLVDHRLELYCVPLDDGE